MERLKTIVRAAAAAFGLATYVWFAAVRALPEVRRRKAVRRLRRRRAAA